MKKFFILIITFILLFSNNSINVNAAAGFSGSGSASGYSGAYSGSSSGECKGWRLNLSPIILFSLVDISDDTILTRLNSYYMINTIGTYDDAFYGKPGYTNNHGAEKIVGAVGSTDGDKFQQFPSEISFSNGTLQNDIIPNETGSFLNFDVSGLKKSIMKNDNEITDSYKKIVIYMLEQTFGNEIANESLTLEQINQNMYTNNGKELGNYRIFIEPVYALQEKCSTKYSFMTTKAIASSIKSGENYKVYISSLYNNLYSDEVVGSLNKDGYISPVTENEYKNYLANPNHGAGYAVVRLSYDIPEVKSCIIEKNEDGDIVFYDSLGGEYLDDDAGDNLEHFIQSCGCDKINSSTYKTEILDSETKTTILNNNCLYRYCESESKDGIFNYYGKLGEKIGDYESFLNSCGCDNEKVIELSMAETFTEIYNNLCDASVYDNYTSNISKCEGGTDNYKVTNKYNIALEDNKYCTFECEEEINIDNMVSKDYYDNNPFTAGLYYILPGMEESKAASSESLSVTGTKYCKVEIKYDNWYQDYEDKLKRLKYYYNEALAYSGMTCETGGCCESNEGVCTSYYQVCTKKYREYINVAGSNPLKFKINLVESINNYTYCPVSDDTPEKIAKYNKEKYTEYRNRISILVNKLKNCYKKSDSILKSKDKDSVYYKFNSEINYNYEQKYTKFGNVWNYDRASKIGNINQNDQVLAKYKSNYNNVVDLNDIEVREETTDKSKYLDKTTSDYLIDVVNTETIRNGNKIDDQQYYRKVSYKYYYRPSIMKYIDTYNADISDDFSSLLNPIKLGYFYDLDVTAITSDNNNTSYVFTKLGDDNKIYNYYYNRGEISKLERKCTYKITNDLIKCDGNNCKLSVMYRSVDPSEIDPNDRILDDDKGFSNWKDDKGRVIKTKIENDAKEDVTYSPENLEYSFTLDSATIKAIREYNIGKKYSDYIGFKCDSDGNECKSDFISNANAIDGIKGEVGIEFGTSINGRNTWKIYTKDNLTGKYYIDGEKIELTS